MNTTEKPYLIVVYGKNGCDRCALLKDEVNRMLAEEKLSDRFGFDYQNLSTIDGMTAYAVSETINGQRIPALQIMRYDAEKQNYVKIPDTRPEIINDASGDLFVPVYLQLQTDHTPNTPAISRDAIMELVSLAENRN